MNPIRACVATLRLCFAAPQPFHLAGESGWMQRERQKAIILPPHGNRS